MTNNTISQFNLQPGRVLARKYEVIGLLGAGWEGEVYRIMELDTGVERAAKIFFPKRNVQNKSAIAYAQKLAPKIGSDGIMIINLSGRGDKDIQTIAKIEGVEI